MVSLLSLRFRYRWPWFPPPALGASALVPASSFICVVWYLISRGTTISSLPSQESIAFPQVNLQHLTPPQGRYFSKSFPHRSPYEMGADIFLHLIFLAQRPLPTTISGFPRCHSIWFNAARFTGRFWRSNKKTIHLTSAAAPEIQNPRFGSPVISAARHRRERPPNPRAHRGPACRPTAPAPAVVL